MVGFSSLITPGSKLSLAKVEDGQWRARMGRVGKNGWLNTFRPSRSLKLVFLVSLTDVKADALL